MKTTIAPLLLVFLAACSSNSPAPLLIADNGADPSQPPPRQFNVLDFGARGDATSDDTAAFQSAIDAAGKSGGGIVFVPRGNYLIKSHLVVRPHVTLMGVFQAPTARTQNLGSTLLAVDDAGGMEGTPFLTLLANATLKGLTVFYPNQVKDLPRPYPWTVRGQGDNCTIRDVLMVNPYAAVDFGTHPCGRHLIDGLYAQALYRGLLIDKCFDVGRVSNVHFWPFWQIDQKLMKWTEENGVAFTIGRTDWQYMTNCFCISYKVGFHFRAFKDGPGNAVLTNCGSDIGPCAVLVDEVQSHAGVSFVNGQFMAGIDVKPTNTGPVKFTACGFWGVQGVTTHHALLEGKGQTFFSNCHFIGWDQKGGGNPAIHARSGGLTVNACDFMDAGKEQIQLDRAVEAAIITGNRFRGGVKIANASDGDVQIGLNAGK